MVSLIRWKRVQRIGLARIVWGAASSLGVEGRWASCPMNLIETLIVDSLQVQRQVEFLFKKLHAQDKNTIFSVFPDILRTLCESTTLQHGEKEQILSTLSPYVTADKQNRNLIDNILGRMMVELPDVNAAKFCLHGVRLFKTSAETSAAIVKAIAYALPKIGEKLEDEGFAKLLLVCSLPGSPLNCFFVNVCRC